MITLVPISTGELLDKLSILEIKLKKVKDASKLENIKREHGLLLEVIKSNNLKGWKNQAERLFKINSSLWDIEDRIRIKEKLKEFDKEFVALARSVYVTNDLRFSAKSEVNEMYDSNVVEEKSYEVY